MPFTDIFFRNAFIDSQFLLFPSSNVLMGFAAIQYIFCHFFGKSPFPSYYFNCLEIGPVFFSKMMILRLLSLSIKRTQPAISVLLPLHCAVFRIWHFLLHVVLLNLPSSIFEGMSRFFF